MTEGLMYALEAERELARENCLVLIACVEDSTMRTELRIRLLELISDNDHSVLKSYAAPVGVPDVEPPPVSAPASRPGAVFL